LRKLLHVLRYLVPLGTLAALAIGFLVTRWRAQPIDVLDIAPAPESMLRPLEPMPRTRVLAGRVTAPDASPVAEALVWLRAGDEPHWTYTDASGDFRIEDIGPDPWMTSIVARGFDPMLVTLADTGGAQTIRLERAADPLPSLAPIVRSRLKGIVIPSLPGSDNPRGYEIVLVPRAPPESLGAPVPRRVLTDRGGAFEIADLAHGSYAVRVLPYWARGGSWPDLARGASSREPLVLVHNASTAVDELRVQLEDGAITGTVQSAEKQPLEAVLVLIAQSDDPSRVWPPVSTASDGSFAARDLPPGNYLVSLHAGAAASEQVVSVPARTAQHVEFEPLQTVRAH
jgi:hypothetical protein